MSSEPITIAARQSESQQPISSCRYDRLPAEHGLLFTLLGKLLEQWLAERPDRRPQVAVVTNSPLPKELRMQIGLVADLAVRGTEPLEPPLGRIENRSAWLDFILFLEPLPKPETHAGFVAAAYYNLNENGVLLSPVSEGFAPAAEDSRRLTAGRQARLLFDRFAAGGFSVRICGAPPAVAAADASLRALELGSCKIQCRELPGSAQGHSLLMQAVRTQRRSSSILAGCAVRPKALVYNNYFRTAGGGERSTLDMALSLEQLGFDVSLAVAQKMQICMDTLKASFGIAGERSWPLQQFLSEKELAEGIRKQQIDLFVNHTFCSYMENPAPLGWYMVMFPYAVSAAELERLSTYGLVPCISRFTEQYVHRRWSPKLTTAVLSPPISAVHAEKEPVSFSEKEPLILNIGRFNVKGHNKCQLEAIESFVSLIEAGVLSDRWRMVVAGYVNRSPDNDAYLRQCRETAEGAPVEILTNASFDEIRGLYRKAACLWQFTGFGLPFGTKPERCEHLGLVALDCFSYGVVPVVYQRGEMSWLIRHGVDGFCVGSMDDLKGVMSLLDEHFMSPYHQGLFAHVLHKAEAHSFEAFKNQVENHVRLGMGI